MARREALARRRRSLGLSQEALADTLGVDRKTVARWEAGGSSPHPWQRPGLARALLLSLPELDQHLEDEPSSLPASPGHGDGAAAALVPSSAGGGQASSARTLLRLTPAGDLVAEIDRRRVIIASAAAMAHLAARPADGMLIPARPIASDDHGFASAISSRWPGAEATTSTTGKHGAEWQLRIPPGRNMRGTAATVHIRCGRLLGGRVIVPAEEASTLAGGIERNDRAFVAAAVDQDEDARYFLLDARVARARLAAGAVRDVTIPASHELDDLTFGIVWATANLDDALLADDRLLHEARDGLRAYERLTASAVSRESAPDLNPIAHMYLGSDFCARYILRRLPELSDAPFAWTKEQSGEDASTWLLFDHKYRYLRATVARAGGSMYRGFCVPEVSVSASPLYERVILFLAVALMESLGIRAQLTADPSYACVEGFVLASGRRQALIANWIGGDGMWHVDLTTRTSQIAEFEDAAGGVAAGSIIVGEDPGRRLHALADYLGLDWAWLVRRCGELGRRGSEQLIQPRSRLIAATGVDAACQYVGSLHAQGA